MPIVEVEIVIKPNEVIQNEIAPKLADQLGQIFDSPKGGTWIKLHTLSENNYAENGGREEGVYPIFVSVLKAKVPPPEEFQPEVDKITGAVAQICDRPPTLIHVIYAPQGSGRVAFGGKIIS